MKICQKNDGDFNFFLFTKFYRHNLPQNINTPIIQ